MLVDTHCHLDFDKFAEDLDDVIQRAVAADVRKMIIPAVDLESIPQVLAVAEKYQWVYAAVGVHPNSTADLPPDWLAQIRTYASHHKVLAIGEIGLDYYWDKSPKAVQQAAFTAQLQLAYELQKPTIIHNREADEDVLRLLRQSPLAGDEVEKPGVLHSFMGSWDTAVDAVEMGFYLGFTGPVTYPKNESLREVAREMPMDRLLVETDAPFLAPQSQRGRRNEPAYVSEISTFIANLRGLDPAIFANMTTENAACLFGRDAIYR
ncbi:MAG: TatD family hydrolase [Chloroflexi bacterium]|nr:TatD family hydrolase [Chloroflexota bacterium]